MWMLEGPRDVVFLRFLALGCAVAGLVVLGVTLLLL